MPDPIEPPILAAITDEPQAEAMEPMEGKDPVTKMTHEVDTNDMFSSSA